MPKPARNNPPDRSQGSSPANGVQGPAHAAAPSPRPSRSANTAPSLPFGDTAALAPLRQRIDALDRDLVSLLNRRAELVVEVGKLKREHGIPVYAPHREAQVLSRVLDLNQGPLHARTIEGVYRELMSGSFRLELPIRIGFLGPPGSYSHLAAVKHFGTSVDFEDLRAIGGVFTEVARGHVDYGLVPIENSIGGGIVETLAAFQEFHNDLQIYAEVQIEVHHALLANCAPSQVRTIYSKPEVFQQCRTWLATQYPTAELVAEPSSSRAVQRVADAPVPAAAPPLPASKVRGKSTPAPKKRASAVAGVAAIGSTLAAELYGVSVLFANIEDNPNNITRFFVLSRQKAKPSGPFRGVNSAHRPGEAAPPQPPDKTSIMFATLNEPGALVNVLAVFQRAGINLTHIDKRPSGRTNWSYSFFIDLEGHADDPWIAAALAQASGLCREFHVLGSYPRSQRIL